MWGLPWLDCLGASLFQAFFQACVQVWFEIQFRSVHRMGSQREVMVQSGDQGKQRDGRHATGLC